VIYPALAALVVLLIPSSAGKQIARYAALALGLVFTALTVSVFSQYQLLQINDPQAQQLVSNTPWFTVLGASWHVGLDGISAAMVLLTGILTPLAIIISFEIEERVNMHLALVLFFATGCIGVFVAQDLMIFFLFYELSLVPMYFLINQWGGPNRKYASTKFFIYSMGGLHLLDGWLAGYVAGDPVDRLVDLAGSGGHRQRGTSDQSGSGELYRRAAFV